MTTIGRWSPSKVRNRIIDGTWVTASKFAMEIIKPSSVDITGSGSEAYITSFYGSVEFTTCETLSLNGVFSSEYDNYMVVVSGVDAAGQNLRMRSGGNDNSTASSYVSQLLSANSTTIQGFRDTTTFAYLNYQNAAGPPLGYVVYVFGPYLTQPTAGRSVTTGTDAPGNFRISDHAFTHNQLTSYDGITIYPSSGTFTGRVAVYGMRG